MDLMKFNEIPFDTGKTCYEMIKGIAVRGGTLFCDTPVCGKEAFLNLFRDLKGTKYESQGIDILNTILVRFYQKWSSNSEEGRIDSRSFDYQYFLSCVDALNYLTKEER